MSENNCNKIFLPAIHYCRGLAALVVVCVHAAQASMHINLKYADESFQITSLFAAGGCGVQFFFVLSGFIIHHIHSRDEINTKNLRRFFKKRFVRVFPIYWIALIISYILMVCEPKYMPELSRGFTELVKNILLLRKFDGMMVPVAWTLCHEVLFYLIFALSFYFLRRWHYVFIGWSICCALYGIASHFPSEFSTEAHNNKLLYHYIFGSNNILFYLGILSSCLIKVPYSKNLNLISKIFSNHTCIKYFGFTMFILLYYYQNTLGFNRDYAGMAFWIETILYGISFSCIIISLSNIGKLKISKIWSLNVLGDSSYSLYLFHLFTITIVGYLIKMMHVNITTNEAFLILVISSVLTGVIVHKLIEVPLLNVFRKF
jgi:exopolysaccharide production protein ExoZ